MGCIESWLLISLTARLWKFGSACFAIILGEDMESSIAAGEVETRGLLG